MVKQKKKERPPSTENCIIDENMQHKTFSHERLLNIDIIAGVMVDLPFGGNTPIIVHTIPNYDELTNSLCINADFDLETYPPRFEEPVERNKSYVAVRGHPKFISVFDCVSNWISDLERYPRQTSDAILIDSLSPNTFEEPCDPKNITIKFKDLPKGK